MHLAAVIYMELVEQGIDRQMVEHFRRDVAHVVQHLPSPNRIVIKRF